MNRKLSEMNCSRGAPLGRRSQQAASRNEKIKFHIRRIRLNNGGYDSGGAYWGIGKPLYWAYSTEEHPTQFNGEQVIEFFFRADDHKAAQFHILETYPFASFFRK